MPQKKPPPRGNGRPQRPSPHTPPTTPTTPTTPTSPASATPASAPPRYLTVREVAALLRATPKAIYTRIERGQLPGVVRVSRRVLIDFAILSAWLESLREPPRPPKPHTASAPKPQGAVGRHTEHGGSNQ